MTKDEEKAFFVSVFNIKIKCPQDMQHPELEVRDRELSEAQVIHEEVVSDLLCQLDRSLCHLMGSTP